MNKFFVFFVLIVLIGCTTEISTQKIKQKNTAVEINNQNIDDEQNKSDGITASAITGINQNNPAEQNNIQKSYNEVDIIKKNTNTKNNGTTKTTTSSSTSTNNDDSQNTTQPDQQEYQNLGNVICLNEKNLAILDEISCETDFDCTEDVLMDLCYSELYDYELTFEYYITEKTAPDCAIKVICYEGSCQAVCEI